MSEVRPPAPQPSVPEPVCAVDVVDAALVAPLRPDSVGDPAARVQAALRASLVSGRP